MPDPDACCDVVTLDANTHCNSCEFGDDYHIGCPSTRRCNYKHVPNRACCEDVNQTYRNSCKRCRYGSKYVGTGPGKTNRETASMHDGCGSLYRCCGYGECDDNTGDANANTAVAAAAAAAGAASPLLGGLGGILGLIISSENASEHTSLDVSEDESASSPQANSDHANRNIPKIVDDAIANANSNVKMAEDDPDIEAAQTCLSDPVANFDACCSAESIKFVSTSNKNLVCDAMSQHINSSNSSSNNSNTETRSNNSSVDDSDGNEIVSAENLRLIIGVIGAIAFVFIIILVVGAGAYKKKNASEGLMGYIRRRRMMTPY